MQEIEPDPCEERTSNIDACKDISLTKWISSRSVHFRNKTLSYLHLKVFWLDAPRLSFSYANTVLCIYLILSTSYSVLTSVFQLEVKSHCTQKGSIICCACVDFNAECCWLIQDPIQIREHQLLVGSAKHKNAFWSSWHLNNEKCGWASGSAKNTKG